MNNTEATELLSHLVYSFHAGNYFLYMTYVLVDERIVVSREPLATH